MFSLINLVIIYTMETYKGELIPLENKSLLNKFEIAIRAKLSQKKYVKWNCSACTFENLICQSVCEICDTERDNSESINQQTENK
jgi:hypothetical protein